MSVAKRKFFYRALHFFGFTSTISRFGKRFRVVSTVWSLSRFLFFLLSVPPCPVICKSVGTCPRALDGVSVTFVLQFHTRKQCKTAIQSECIASQGLFPIFFAFKITHRVILLTRFCKLLTRVATPSGGARASSASMARCHCKYLITLPNCWHLRQAILRGHHWDHQAAATWSFGGLGERSATGRLLLLPPRLESSAHRT